MGESKFNPASFHIRLWGRSSNILRKIDKRRASSYTCFLVTNSEKNYPTLIQNISDMLFIEKPFNYLRILLQ